jgi:hypothetical protein
MSVEPDGPPADNAVAAGSTDSDGGVMVEFAEEEYLYGLGVLRLRVTGSPGCGWTPDGCSSMASASTIAVTHANDAQS